MTVNINDYSQADTFDVEIDYKQFPFDPRSIRAVAVTIAMEDVGHLYDSNNSPTRIHPRPPEDPNTNVIFVGFADEESMNFDDTKRTVRFEGRDYTSLLIDRKYLAGPVNLEQPVDVVISKMLEELNETVKLKIENRTGAELPILAKFYDSKDDVSGRKNVAKDESYWDLIQRIISQAGLICYIELDKLVISTPRILYGNAAIKRFIYGRNIKNLEFKRKVGRRKNFNVVVRAMNLSTKEVITAKIPAEATPEWSKATGIPIEEIKIPEILPGDKPKDQQALKPAPYISFRLSNINDKSHLVSVGENIYEELGRQQIEGSIETADMMVIQSGFRYDKTAAGSTIAVETGRTEFDILKLRNGTPVSVWIDTKDLEKISTFANVADIKKYAIERHLDPKVAAFLADTLNKADASFYTKSVQFTLDETSGFKVKVEIINFIQVTNPNVEKGA